MKPLLSIVVLLSVFVLLFTFTTKEEYMYRTATQEILSAGTKSEFVNSLKSEDLALWGLLVSKRDWVQPKPGTDWRLESWKSPSKAKGVPIVVDLGEGVSVVVAVKEYDSQGYLEKYRPILVYYYVDKVGNLFRFTNLRETTALYRQHHGWEWSSAPENVGTLGPVTIIGWQIDIFLGKEIPVASVPGTSLEEEKE